MWKAFKHRTFQIWSLKVDTKEDELCLAVRRHLHRGNVEKADVVRRIANEWRKAIPATTAVHPVRPQPDLPPGLSDSGLHSRDGCAY